VRRRGAKEQGWEEKDRGVQGKKGREEKWCLALHHHRTNRSQLNNT
jgi:hypothetical protein